MPVFRETLPVRGIPGILRGFPGSTGTGKLQDIRRGFGGWNSTVP